MKIRNGFVSNSSSSSYIIAIKDESSNWIKSFIEAFENTRHIEYIRSDYERFLKDYGSDDEDTINYKRILDIYDNPQDGYKNICIEYDRGSETVDVFIEKLEANDCIKILLHEC